MSTENEVRCDECDWTGAEDDMEQTLYQINHLADRIEPGGVVPAGTCPECDALVYPVTEAVT